MIIYNRIYTNTAGEQDRDFNHEVRTFFEPQMRPGMDLCHSISYATIQDAVILALNNYSVSRVAAKLNMDGIINAVTYMSENSDWIDDEDYQKNGRDTRRICSQKYRSISDMETAAQVCQAANEIVDLLNNCYANLRPGDSSWNRKISYSYDPKDWIYVDLDEERICGGDNSVLRYRGMSPDELEEYENSGFYLTDLEDGVRLGLLTSNGLENLVSLDRYVKDEDLMYIASSSNLFPNTEDSVSYDQVYYLNSEAEWTELF